MKAVTYNNFLTQDECNTLIQLSNESTFVSAAITNPDSYGIDESYRKCSTTPLDVEKVSWLKDDLFQSLNQINLNEFQYTLKGITELQIIRYDVGSFYKKHVDIVELDEFGFQRKLTFIIQLSNPNDYQGGNLVLHTSDTPEILPNEQGCITVFPTYILHEVTPILSGTRYSLIGWCFGPPFK